MARVAARTEPLSESISLARAGEQFLAHLAVERSVSPNTLSAYRSDLSKYFAHLASRGRADLAGVEQEDVASFPESLEAMAAASVARSLAAVRSFHRFAFEEGLTAANPAGDVRPPKLASRLPKALTVDHVASLIEATRVGEGPVPLRDCALVELLYGTGARISEAVGLSGDDLDLPGAAVRLFGKGRKERVVPLGGYAVEAMEAYLVRARPSSSSTRGAGRCPARAPGARSRPPPAGPASPRTSALTRCATPSPPTCSRGEPTCGWSRSCSAIPR